MRKRNDCYVMMDVEASGQRLGHHDMIQFGATAAYGPKLETRVPFPVYRPRADLPINLIAPLFGGEPEPGAMKVNKLPWDAVRLFGEPPAVWAARFHGWVASLKAASGAEKVVLVGHGIVFDWAYVRLVYDHCRTDWPCHYSGLDAKSFWGGVRALEYIDSSMTDMRETFGLKENPNAHDAQADADFQLELMIRAFVKSGIIEA